MSRPRVELIICLTLLTAIFILSLVLRISVPWDHVFVGNWVKFTDNDAYFYMRMLDNISHHFPLLSNFDPYYIFPDGHNFAGEPLFYVYLMGSFAWLFGGGAPSQHLVDLIGVYFPAVMGALLVFPVFLIGKLVFSKWAGLAAALLIALMPGEFLVRTLLGNTDIHVLEVFLTTLLMLFILLAVKTWKDVSTPFSVSSFRQQWLPLIYSTLAGICLGAYLLSWRGALLFVFISFIWLVIQSVSDRFHGKSTLYLAIVCFTTYLVALAIALTSPVTAGARIPLLIAMLTAIILPTTAEYMRRRNINAPYYLLLAAALGGVALLILYAVSPQALGSMFNTFTEFFRWNTGTGIAEDQPLLINQGTFTLGLLWGNYTAASLLAVIALVIVIYKAVREGRHGEVLLAVWSIVILLATLAMRRFAYYLAINVAVLGGYTGWLILLYFGLREKSPETGAQAGAGKDLKRKSAKGKRQSYNRGGRPARRNPALVAVGIAVVLLLLVYPNTGPLPGGDRPFFQVASQGLNAPGDGWCESLDWLRNNSPEPFGESQYYYDYYITPHFLSSYAAGYSVVCWWDYGYWVTRIGRRVPLSNPGSGKAGEQNLMLAQNGQDAGKISADHNMKYLILNDYLVDWRSGFEVLASNAGQTTARYYEIYYRRQNDKLVPTLLYYPDYYNTLVVRLYNFGGDNYLPGETAVISWEQMQGGDGKPYKEITGLKTFPGYSQAADFIAAQKAGNWRIVGKDPNVSPVPLEKLQDFRLAHASSQKAKIGTADIPAVKIFEFTGVPHE